MKRALIGRTSLLSRRVRRVKTRKIQRPSSLLPIAWNRSSDFESRGSGSTAIELRKHGLDHGPGNAVLLTLGPVALVPIKAGYLHRRANNQQAYLSMDR